MYQFSSLSVVVPVYNSATLLPLLLDRLVGVLSGLDLLYEIVLVNDCSSDSSWGVVQRMVECHPGVRGINLMRNYGQHNALLCGIRAAQHEVIVTLDDDLQNPPEELPKLLSQIRQEYDVVYGTPQHEKQNVLRRMATWLTMLSLQGAMGAETARSVSSYRVFRTQVRDAFVEYDGPFVSIDVLLTWGTTQFAAVPVRHEPRRFGTSNYTLRKLITHALNMITGFSVLPLQIASYLGFAFTLFGISVFTYVIGRHLIEGSNVPGFAFLASIVAIFAGAQLFALGIIGEYLARMFHRISKRPAYIVREIVQAQAAVASDED